MPPPIPKRLLVPATHFIPLLTHPCRHPAPIFLHRRRATTSAPQTTPTCPPATCACAATPPLDIDHTRPLSGTMPSYHEHIVLPSGRSDWTSRIEDDEGLGVVKELKGLLGPQGRFSNPFHNVMITASSLPPPPSSTVNTNSTATSTTTGAGLATSALLFPSFRRVTALTPNNQPLDTFIRAFVLPENHDPRAISIVDPSIQAHLLRQSSLQSEFRVSDIDDVVVLICGHNARDSRCGVLGPILADEFEGKLQGSLHGLKQANRTEADNEEGSGSVVAQISHIGGHKFAGNVIIYIPPVLDCHPLAGKGIWYGRVEPKHVEGIIKETIEKGVIIQDLFRGGIGKGGEMLRV